MGALQAHREEALALRLGFDLGLTLIDTAEIYGDGQAEQLIGEILSDRRDEIFIVSKVAPQNAGPGRLREHCEASLRRLNTDRIDLYLLHWRDHRPLAEIVEGMEALKAAGKIRHWGVSNFDVADMEALMAAGGEGCAANQIAYNLATRGAEFALQPWLAARGIALMAYSPMHKAKLLNDNVLREIGRSTGVSPAAVALNWVLRHKGVIAIPKAANSEHMLENRRALDFQLDAEDLRRLDAAYLPPIAKTPLVLL
jgi:diketogulonate reductase-like aldo/keto reductase